MTIKTVFGSLALQLLFLLSAFSSGAEVLTANDGVVHVRSGLSFLADTNHLFTIQEVMGGAHVFTPFRSGTMNMGNSKSAYWLKLTVTNETEQPTVLLKIANSALDTVIFFDPQPDGKVRTIKSGESLPFAAHPYKSTDYIFAMQIQPHASKNVYLKISSSDPLLIPMSLGTTEQIFSQDKSKDIFWGIYIGIMLAMVVYNTFIYVSTKDNIYLSYLIYVLAVLIAQINISGYAAQLLWPNTMKVAFYSAFITPYLVGIAGLEFGRRFLHTKVYTPKSDKLFMIANCLYTIAFLIAIFGKYDIGLTMIDMTAGLSAFIILSVAIRIVLVGYRPAIFFLVAWSVFLVGIFVFVFKNLNILPYNNFTIYTMPIGSALEVVLLSIALADKINTLKKEKDSSQAQALFESEKNAELIKTQNVLLETKVVERTSELNELNGELTSAISDLKGAQAQLVESEKMASLGQLTAGIAHEINNPINFVISNVKPLKRDVAMLVDAFSQVEQMLREQHPDDNIVNTINKLKEELEYDYLTTEIDFLLKGISEGSERTAEIVKGLRIFARVDENDLKTTNIHDGIDSTIIIVNTLLSDKITVEKDYGPLSVIECFPGKLNQAFLNIISNGIHAIKSRIGEQSGGKISIRTWVEGDDFNVSIRDNGCGMPEEVRNKIFEPFYSTKDVGEGTGLGLSIAYNIIKKHNGQISVESVVNEGTEFILTIPVNQQYS